MQACDFPVYAKVTAWFVNLGDMINTVRGTWNFGEYQATLAQGCVSEVHMNMDVNLHRLPELILYSSKFLVPFTVFMLSLQLTNRAVTLYHRKTVSK